MGKIVEKEISFYLDVLIGILENSKLENSGITEIMLKSHMDIIVEIFREEKDKIKRFDALVNYEPCNDYFYPYENDDDPDYAWGMPSYYIALTFLNPLERE